VLQGEKPGHPVYFTVGPLSGHHILSFGFTILSAAITDSTLKTYVFELHLVSGRAHEDILCHTVLVTDLGSFFERIDSQLGDQLCCQPEIPAT
jgi:hypothetical protein